MMQKILILLLLASLGGFSAWAQDLPELTEVVVTATRVESGLVDSPSFVTVITRKDIEESGATNLAGALAAQSGVVVNDNGAEGSPKTVSIRGSSSAQVLVLLDGMRLNSSRDGTIDLATIPLEDVERVEVVRGGESVVYGTGAIGGVINVITRTAAKPGISLRLTNGSYIPRDAYEVTATFPSVAKNLVAANFMDLLDSQRLSLSLSGKLGDVGVSGGGAVVRAANAFTWNDATLINDWRRRSYAEDFGGEAFAGLDAALLDGRLAAKASVALSNTDAPGSVKYVSTTAKQKDTNASVSLSWKTDRFLADALNLDLKAFYRYDELGYADPAYPPDSLHTTHSASLDLTQKLTYSEQFFAVYGGSIWYDWAKSTSFSAVKDRLNVAAFLSVPFTPLEALTFSPSLRYDYFSDFPGSFSLKLSTVYLLSDNSSVKASIGNEYRVPTLNDLYFYDSSGFTLSNPNLKPEASYSGEVGCSLETRRLAIDVSVFGRWVSNHIIWQPNASFIFMPQNLTALLPGVEFHGRAVLGDLVSLELNYTFLYSMLLNDGSQDLRASDNRRVPMAPMHNFSAGARYRDRINSAGVALKYESMKYIDSANTESLALSDYWVVDVDYALAATENLTFSVALRNLFNQLYFTQSGYPMPPFSVETGVRVKL
jgi:outer membrane cobalamin receptor